MEITPSRSEGLEREWKITVPAEELSQRLESRLQELRATTRLRGFRPGKVPLNHLRKLYGRKLMGEVINGVMQETGRQILQQDNLRAATHPRIELAQEDMKGGMEAVERGESHLAYRVSLEVVPEMELRSFSELRLIRPVTKVTPEDVEETLNRIASQRRSFLPREEEDAEAREGDRVRLDFDGTMDGRAFPGSEGRGVVVEIPAKDSSATSGFEARLLGRKRGKGELSVIFPKEYPDANLAGKDASFSIDIKEISAPQEIAINDDFATAMGAKNLQELRRQISDAITADDARATRAKLKRQLLDQLAEQYTFALPNGMVRQELAAIQAQVTGALSRENAKSGENNANPSEEELQREYAPIAERRVRLALLLNEIGRNNNIQVTSEEVSRVVAIQAQNLPRQEQQRLYAHYRDHPEALERIRAPIFEDKVADFLFELAQVEEREVSREELYRDEDAGEAASETEDNRNTPKKKSGKKAGKKK